MSLLRFNESKVKQWLFRIANYEVLSNFSKISENVQKFSKYCPEVVRTIGNHLLYSKHISRLPQNEYVPLYLSIQEIYMYCLLGFY